MILTSYARKGVNALDAMVQLWNNISMMRQQLMPTDRVHGIVTDGGKAVSLWIKFGLCWMFLTMMYSPMLFPIIHLLSSLSAPPNTIRLFV